MKFNITAFFVLVLAIIAGQFISNRFLASNPGNPENEVKKKVSNSGDPVKDFLDDY